MTAPDKIYLTEELADEGTYLCCEDRITPDDTEYIRSDVVPRWIPVTEKLPEVGKAVLIVSKEAFYGIAIDELAGLSPVLWDYYGTELVTHWQPLPEAPK